MKLKYILILFVAVMFLVYPSVSEATPKYSLSLIEPTNSQGLVFSDDNISITFIVPEKGGIS